MIRGKCKTLMLMAFMILGISSISHATDYYVDAASGNDGSAGTQSAPWQTVTKVNNASLSAGSTVYFKAGGSYGSTVLIPKSGTAGSPVTYTSYGTGAKPSMGWFDATGKSYAKASGLSFSS